jgi:hypothetical protein
MRFELWRRLRHNAPAAAMLLALLPGVAGATLGEPEATVQTDTQLLRGAIKSTARSNYRVHEIQLPSGTVLREFVASDGNVFAIAWSGPALPNLRQTLGRYFDTYVAAAQAKQMGRNHLHVVQDNLVIQAGGHMRAFTGRAYLPQAVPAGVSLGDLR